mmetsp:Transcript_18150/g.54814  ORF Transcript_18150/g.54814 Transcript_18150/m.54814 type:complete len:271 (+) Transcript_18150:1035-1847(+)
MEEVAHGPLGLDLVGRPLRGLGRARSRKQNCEDHLHDAVRLHPAPADEDVGNEDDAPEHHIHDARPVCHAEPRGPGLPAVLHRLDCQQRRIPLHHLLAQAEGGNCPDVAHGLRDKRPGFGFVGILHGLEDGSRADEHHGNEGHAGEGQLPRRDGRNPQAGAHGDRHRQHPGQRLARDGLDEGRLGGQAVRQVSACPRVEPGNLLPEHGPVGQQSDLPREGLRRLAEEPELPEGEAAHSQGQDEKPEALLIRLAAQAVHIHGADPLPGRHV